MVRSIHRREGGIEGGRGAGRSSPTEAQRSVEEEDDKEGGGGSPRGVYRSPQESRAALNRNSERERERERESRVRWSNYQYWGASLCIAYARLTLC